MTDSVWAKLAVEHKSEIELHGFANFKRTVNFQYGQWRIASYWDRKILALALRGQVSLWGDSPYESFTQSLWRFAQRHDQLGVLRLEEPLIGNPISVYLDGRLVTQDLAFSALDINRMNQHIPLVEKRNVLEIGGGCGRLAWAFKKLFSQASYTILDIEPTRSLAKRYLAECGVEVSFPDEISERQSFDLVINTSSFDEMPSETAIGYLRLIEQVCHGHVFLNGMGKASHDRRRARLGLDELPYSPQWHLMYARRHPVLWTHRWIEKIFEVNN